MRCPQGDPGTLKTTEVQLKRRCRVAPLNSDSLSDDPATMRDLFDKEIGRISGALSNKMLTNIKRTRLKIEPYFLTYCTLPKESEL